LDVLRSSLGRRAVLRRRFQRRCELGAILLVAVVSAALSVSPAAGSPATSAGDWPMTSGGPEHTGEAEGAPAPPLKQVWRRAPGGDGRVSGAAVVAGLAVATGQKTIFGFDASSGQILWSVPRTAGPLTVPAFGGSEGAGGNGPVVFTEGDRAGNSAVGALDPATRRRLWTFRLDDLVRGSPTVGGNTVFVGSRNRSLYAIDLATGKLRWKVGTRGAVLGSPTVSAGLVFVASEEARTGRARLAALDAGTGRSRWTYSPAHVGFGLSSVTVQGDRAYAGFNDHVVRAFEAATGRVIWSNPVRGAFSPVSTLAATTDSVYALDDIGGVYRFDATSGKHVWDYQLPSFVTSASPLITSGAVYVGLDDGTVAAIDPANGHLRWRTRLSVGAIGAIAPAGDLLLVPASGPRGGITAFAHDPSALLLDETSPTVLDLGAALANFGGAFIVMMLLLLGVFRFLGRTGSPTWTSGPLPEVGLEEPEEVAGQPGSAEPEPPSTGLRG